MLTCWKNSTYSKCKFNNDTNIVLMGININNNHWCLLVANYKKKDLYIIDSLQYDTSEIIRHFMLV